MEMEGKKRFPLREAYAFATERGLASAVAEIRDMEIEWDRPYTSSVRRGLMIALLKDKALLEEFCTAAWPLGNTPAGEAEMDRCRKIYDDFQRFNNEPRPDDAPEDQRTFAIEAHLRDFLAKNIELLERGLRLYAAEDNSGVEFPVEGGRIDLLCIDGTGRFVVVELKLSRGRNRALGQLLYYMGWVDKNLGKAPCRGIIVGSEITPELVTAVGRVPGVALAQYKMSFAIQPISEGPAWLAPSA